MKRAMVLLAVACRVAAPEPGPPPAGSAAAEVAREGPFLGRFTRDVSDAPPGAVVELVLVATTLEAVADPRLLVQVPAGVVVVDGPASGPLPAWAAQERRELRWRVRVDDGSEALFAVRLAAGARGNSYGVLFHPPPDRGTTTRGPDGALRRVVRVPTNDQR